MQSVHQTERFNKLIEFLRSKPVEMCLGSAADLEQLLNSLQTAAAILVSGWAKCKKDKDLARAIMALREDEGGHLKFESALNTVSQVVYADMCAGKPVEQRTPHDLIKAAARSAGHTIGKERFAVDSLSAGGEDGGDHCLERIEDNADTSIWNLRQKDPDCRHGDCLPVSTSMIVGVRDSLAAAAGIQNKAASRVMTAAIRAAALVVSRAPVARDFGRVASRVDDMALEVGALADLAIKRLRLADAPQRWVSMDDASIALIALTLPLAKSTREIDALLTLNRENQLLTLYALGNRSRMWLGEHSRNPSLSGPGCQSDPPTLAAAMAKIGKVKSLAAAAVRRAAGFRSTTGLVQAPLAFEGALS